MRAQSSARAQILISGRVQGVAYRAFAQHVAREKGLRGGVRNLHDGRVEVLAEGEKARIVEFVDALKVGPPSARVEDVQIRWEAPTGLPAGFEIWY